MKRLALLAIFAILAALFVPAGLALAQGDEIPPMPAAYYGSVKNTKGESVAAGTVEVYIEGQKRGELAFTNGYYGGDPATVECLIVQGPKEILDKPVTFKVVVSNQSYQAQSSPASVIMKDGDVKRVDLTVDYSAPAPVLPEVTSTDPANNTSGVPVDKTVTVTFSKPVQQGTAYNNITLTDAQNNSVSITKSINSNILTIDSTANLSPKTTYTVTIPTGTVKDANGNPNASYTFKFTTGETMAGPQPPQPPGPISFTDFNGHWAKDTVLQLVYLGIIKGYQDNTFRPAQEVTLAEAAAMIMRLLDLIS